MSKKKNIIISSIVILLIAGIGAGLFLYFDKKDKENNPGGISGYILGEGMEPGLTPEEIQELLQKKIDASKVAFSIYSEPKFNGKKGTIMFANPKHSAHDISLQVTVGDRTIIKTDKISPNQYIEEIEIMGKALVKGIHKGTAMITAYSRENGEQVGKVAVDMSITVE